VNGTSGELEFQQTVAAGGIGPRQFSINSSGTLVAVGLQGSGKVVILERDVETGSYGKFVANVEGLGEVTSVIWDEGC
jgi:6-phosphogluconolactonase (cycloisomerase 2 family)